MRRKLIPVLVLFTSACSGAKQPSNGIYEEEDAGGEESQNFDAAGGKGGAIKADASAGAEANGNGRGVVIHFPGAPSSPAAGRPA